MQRQRQSQLSFFHIQDLDAQRYARWIQIWEYTKLYNSYRQELDAGNESERRIGDNTYRNVLPSSCMSALLEENSMNFVCVCVRISLPGMHVDSFDSIVAQSHTLLFCSYLIWHSFTFIANGE